MRTKLFALACLFVSGTAHGALLDLVYVGDAPTDDDGRLVAAVGDVLTFDIQLDLGDQAALFGVFNTSYSSSTLAFEDWTASGIGQPEFAEDPDELDGLLQGAGFGDTAGISQGLIATVQFRVIAAGAFSVQLGNCDFFGGCWVNAIDFITPIEPAFGGVTGIANVPLPAAAWLLLSGLVALRGGRRPQATRRTSLS